MAASPQRDSALLFNLVILLLIACIGLLLVLRARVSNAPSGEGDAKVGAASWYTTAGRDDLPDQFVWTAVVQNSPAATDAMRCVLLGQTMRAELIVERSGMRLVERTAQNEEQVVAEQTWPRALRQDDRIDWVMQKDGAAVHLNGERVAHIHFPVQTWSRGLWQTKEGAAPFLVFSFQAVDPVYFSDDFMHPPDELGEWVPERGEWAVQTLDNPVRSANAFSLVGTGEDAQIRAGHWFWRNYTVGVSVLSPEERPNFGVRFCKSEAGHYSVEVRTPEDGPTFLRLERTAGGDSTLLREIQVELSPDIWYRLRISQVRGRIRVHVDETLLLTAVDPAPLLGGAVGLLAFDSAGVVYDDVDVVPTRRIRQDFRIQPPAPDGVLDFPEEWAREDRIAVPAGGGTLSLRGIVMENSTLDCRLSDAAALPESFGLELRGRQIGRNWVSLRIRRADGEATAALIVSKNGQKSVVDEASLDHDRSWHGTYSLVFRGRNVYGIHDGNVLCMSDELPSGTAGRSSIRVSDNDRPLAVKALALAPSREMPSLENRVETFEHERSMSNWGTPAAEWTPGKASFGEVSWHRSDFWAEASVTLDTHPVDLDGKVPFGLVFGADVGQDKPVARVDIGVAEAGGEQLAARLLVDEDVRETLLLDHVPQFVTLERFGGRLQAHFDGKLQWSIPLPDGLQSLGRVGRYGPGDEKTWADALTVRGRQVMTYPFKEAPADWTPATGTWEITNRWECDPRWSFFSGHRLDGIASLWHKSRFPDNVTLEFFAGPKMDRSRGGHYQYAADFNAVLAADGYDINSGYSFMLGGWDDKGSFIVRKNNVVVENKEIRIPRKGSTHRRWFYIKIRKQNDRLTFWVDNKKVGSTQDDNLLSGDRLGLWTYKNGMMVAYVRISAGTILPPDQVRAVPDAEPKTPYKSTPDDKKKSES